MTYHAARNNQQLGAFAKEDLQARYNRGEILPTDLVWTEGMSTWQPASQVFGAPVAPIGTDIPAPATPPPVMVPPPVPVTGVATPMYGGAYGATALNAEACPPDHKTLAIVATVLSVLTCSLISLVLGIIAITMSSQVKTKYNAGDVAGAKSSASTAKILSWIAIGILILAFIVGIILGVSGVLESMAHQR